MIQTITNWSRRVPWQAWLALGCVLMAAFWLRQHDAAVRRQVQLQQLRRQTSAQIAALKQRAEQDSRRANVENARAIQEIERRRIATEQQNQRLAAQLAQLRQRAQVQADQAATLPISNVVTRVAAQLGLNSEDVISQRSSSSGEAPAPQVPVRAAAYPPEEPQATKGPGISNSAAVGGGRQTHAAGVFRSAEDGKTAALALSDSGARKVAIALVDLDACRAESGVEQKQILNCQARAQADEAAIERLKGSVASLNDALAAKDKILEQQSGQYKAELRAARGTFLGRLARTTERVAIGVAVGFAIGEVVR